MRRKIAGPLKKIRKPKSRLLKTEVWSSGNRSLEVGKTEVWKSEKPKSGSRKNRSAEVGKTDPNNTYINKNRSNTDSINPSGKNAGKLDRKLDGCDGCHTGIHRYCENQY